MDAEMDSIRSKEDIVLLIGRERPWIEDKVEVGISVVDQLLQRIFRTEEPPLLV